MKKLIILLLFFLPNSNLYCFSLFIKSIKGLTSTLKPSKEASSSSSEGSISNLHTKEEESNVIYKNPEGPKINDASKIEEEEEKEKTESLRIKKTGELLFLFLDRNIDYRKELLINKLQNAQYPTLKNFTFKENRKIEIILPTENISDTAETFSLLTMAKNLNFHVNLHSDLLKFNFSNKGSISKLGNNIKNYSIDELPYEINKFDHYIKITISLLFFYLSNNVVFRKKLLLNKINYEKKLDLQKFKEEASINILLPENTVNDHLKEAYTKILLPNNIVEAHLLEDKNNINSRIDLLFHLLNFYFNDYKIQ